MEIPLIAGLCIIGLTWIGTFICAILGRYCFEKYLVERRPRRYYSRRESRDHRYYHPSRWHNDHHMQDQQQRCCNCQRHQQSSQVAPNVERQDGVINIGEGRRSIRINTQGPQAPAAASSAHVNGGNGQKCLAQNSTFARLGIGSVELGTHSEYERHLENCQLNPVNQTFNNSK